MGIMGTGSIGGEVARAAGALGIGVVGLNSEGREVPGFDRCYPAAERLAFANKLDYLVGVLPETPATDGLVDAELLSVLADDALFINGGRANCVVENDLLAALDSRTLRAAVLDVLPVEPLPDSSPLWRAAAAVFCDNYRRFIAGKPLKYVVDFARGY